MLNFNMLAVLFSSVMGDVSRADIDLSLKLMGMGMLGIFIVMLILFLVIVILDKTTKNKKDD